MKDLGQFEQYDLNNFQDCMDLVDHYGFTNTQIRDAKAAGHSFVSMNKELRTDE